jgi:hypothetical protein
LDASNRKSVAPTFVCIKSDLTSICSGRCQAALSRRFCSPRGSKAVGKELPNKCERARLAHEVYSLDAHTKCSDLSRPPLGCSPFAFPTRPTLPAPPVRIGPLIACKRSQPCHQSLTLRPLLRRILRSCPICRVMCKRKVLGGCLHADTPLSFVGLLPSNLPAGELPLERHVSAAFKLGGERETPEESGGWRWAAAGFPAGARDVLCDARLCAYFRFRSLHPGFGVDVEIGVRMQYPETKPSRLSRPTHPS